MDLGLKNKVIIVAGDAWGIGEGIVRVLSEEGAIVAIIGRNQDENLKLQDELEVSGYHIFPVEADLGEPAACEKTVEAIIRRYGRIDGLVNSSGANDGVGLKTENFRQFMESLRNNLAHYYLMAHFALPYLKISSRKFPKPVRIILHIMLLPLEDAMH
jgi:L-fucose dehydrogenase